MGNTEKMVCIILVNYNGYKDTLECVQSILKSSYTNYKIIIVDNASNDVQLLKDDAYLNSHCEIVYSPANDGFSEGNNIGIKAAEKYDPKYVLLLNNDTVVLPDFLNELVSAAESEENVAITTSFINYFYDKEKSWYCGGNYKRALGYTTMLSSEHVDNKPFHVSFSTGCLMLIYHKVNASTGTGSKMQQYYLVRNYLIVAKKYGTFFPLAYLFRWALSLYEVIRYHYDFSVICRAFRDYKNGVTGKVDYFE